MTLLGNVTCAPRYATQTRGDQGAVFTISSLQVKALYTLFAFNASYVTLPATFVDKSLQLPESTAPLGLKPVRSAIQNALRRLVLAAIKNSLRTLSVCSRM
jgi:hypothetical protein